MKARVMTGREWLNVALMAALVASIGIACILWFELENQPPPPQTYDEASTLAACRAELAKQIARKDADLVYLDGISSACFNELRDAKVLGAYEINRSNILVQQIQGKVMLWMVVAITLSGVGLAALQLFAAYRMVAHTKPLPNEADVHEPGGQVSVSLGKLSVQSSYVGLGILALSLAFFYVYVQFVYPIALPSDAAHKLPGRKEIVNALEPG